MLQKVVEGIDWLIDKVNKIPKVSIAKIGIVAPSEELGSPYADQLATATDERNARIRQHLTTDWVGTFASAAKGAWNSVPNIVSGSTTSYKLTGGSLGNGVKEAENARSAYEKLIAVAEQHIGKKQLETRMLGLNVEEAARLRHEQDLLNKAQSEGIELDQARIEELKRLAAAMAKAERRPGPRSSWTKRPRASASPGPARRTNAPRFSCRRRMPRASATAMK